MDLLPFDVWPSQISQADLPANNNALRAQALAGTVLSKTTDAEPGSPAEGDMYIITGAATGTQWSTFTEDDLAIYTGGTWYAFPPFEGLIKSVAGILNSYEVGTGWVVFAGSVAPASGVTYDNATSGLTATDVQAAIDEVEALASAGSSYQFVGSATVTGSAATTLSISGLDLDADGSYYVTVAIDNAAGSTIAISLYYNADTTATNYYNQHLTVTAASVTGLRTNDGRMTNASANETVTGNVTISKAISGTTRALPIMNRDSGAGVVLQSAAHFWSSTANVTGITLSSSIASSLDIGSKISVWKITQ